jgi:hypothetical protein
MELNKIQQEQADRLRQESILNSFAKAHPPKIKSKKKKSRDLVAEAEYELKYGSQSSRKTTHLESQ